MTSQCLQEPTLPVVGSYSCLLQSHGDSYVFYRIQIDDSGEYFELVREDGDDQVSEPILYEIAKTYICSLRLATGAGEDDDDDDAVDLSKHLAAFVMSEQRASRFYALSLMRGRKSRKLYFPSKQQMLLCMQGLLAAQGFAQDSRVTQF